jgi:hypothetical protein
MGWFVGVMTACSTWSCRTRAEMVAIDTPDLRPGDPGRRKSLSAERSPIEQLWLVCRRIDWQAAASDVPVRSGHTTATPRTVTVAG